MLILGLTGSIGMGKSVTASLFREAGVSVFDADAAVHKLYAGEAVESIERAFPGTTAKGVVDRDALRRRVLDDPAALARLEDIVHPLVARLRDLFLREAAAKGERRVILDIPLLFEAHLEQGVDAVILVTAPESVQKSRVLARPGMTEAQFQTILAKQLPDSEKRRRAQFIVDSGRSVDAARTQVRDILRAVAAMPGQVFNADRLRSGA